MTYAVVTLVFILSMYAFGSYILHTLPIVEAGPTIGVKRTGLRRNLNLNSAYTKVVDGHTYKYRRFVIQGICMTQIGLRPNDIIGVQIFASNAEKTSLKQNDVALIFLNDNKFRGYKIRIVEKIQGNEVETFYYDQDGNKKLSSKSHSLDSILGIVDMNETQRAS